MRTPSAPTIAAIAGISAMALAFLSSAGAQQDSPHPDAASKRLSQAVFAGGCFWCVEADFDKLNGVVDTVSGYTGGHVSNPTYKQVSHKGTGHYEAVRVTYDPDVVSYDTLVSYFFHHVDPTDPNGQFCDKGDSYRTAIFVNTDAERETAEEEIHEIDESGVLKAPVVTKVLKAETFWPAEEYHQDYYKKNPLKYRFYRTTCGRDDTVRDVWAKADSH